MDTTVTKPLPVSIRFPARDRALIEAAAQASQERPAAFIRRAAVSSAKAVLEQFVPGPRGPRHLRDVELKIANVGEMQRKLHLVSQLKAAAEGTFEAVCYTCDGKADLDGDAAWPDAFTEGQDVVISSWAHSSARQSMPVGKGVLHLDGPRLLVRGEFFDTTDGRDAHETMKGLKDIVELSIGYFVKKWRSPTAEERQRGIERVMQEVDVFEVSFVLKGAAGPGRTGVREIKCVGCGTDQCDACRDRTAARALKDRFNAFARREELRAIRDRADIASGERKATKQILERHELPNARVPIDVREAAKEAVLLAGELLGNPGPAIAVRWFSTLGAKEAGCVGCCWPSSGEVWVREDDDALNAYETAAHEAFHHFRPDANEEAVDRFGRLMREIQRATKAGRRLYIGSRNEWQNSPFVRDDDFLVDGDDLTLYRRNGYEWEHITELVA
jgi:hypothetical protein